MPSHPSSPIEPRSALAAIIAGRAQRQSPSQPSLVPKPQPAQPAPIIPAEPTLTQSGGETTQEIFQSLRKSVRAQGNAMVETARFIHLLTERDDWKSLGFAGEDECREAVGLSENLWETHLLLGERLSSLTVDQMREISLTTARLLTSVNAKIWEEFAWVDEARVLRPKEFAALVAKRNQEFKVQGRVGMGAEPRSTLAMTVPASQQERLEGRIESLRRTRKLRSLSDALELALAAAEREPIWSSQIQKLVQAVEELDRVWEQLPVESAEERGIRLAEGESHSVAEAAILTQKITRRMLLVLSDLVQRGSGGSESDGALSNQIERNQTKAAHD